MDTVRADHCSLYGYARKTTPRLEELAAKGLTFETALAQSDWTIPTHTSMFTGLRPITHGVLRLTDHLGSSEMTLAELFERHGLKTAAFTGTDFKRYGLERGFGLSRSFIKAGMGSLRQSMPAAVKWLGQNSKDRFFLFIHGGDAHSPYVCPQAWRDRFSASLGARPMTRIDSSGFPVKFEFGNLPMNDWVSASTETLTEAKALRSDVRSLAGLSDQYDGCLAYGDDQLVLLSTAMTRLHLWENTVLIVTADHGEEFADHGGYGHYGRPLHQEIVHVPLVLIDPKAQLKAGSRTALHFEDIDLLPTIADVEGWPLPAGVEGRSQKAVLEGGVVKERVQYSQGDRSETGNVEPRFEALRLRDWKALRIGSRWELFNLADDPQEKSNLIDSRPDIFLDLAAKRLALEPR